MRLSERLEEALARVSAALNRLQAAAERRLQADALRADLDEELALLQDDRLRLAGELDAALAKVNAVFAASGEVTTRLDRASATVEAVVASLTRDGMEPGPERAGEPAR